MNEEIQQQFWQVSKARSNGIYYLDSAAMTQTPAICSNSLMQWYTSLHGNVHRSEHDASSGTTIAYEHARTTVQKFINATHQEEVFFTKNATEAMNTIAYSWGLQNLHKGDTIAITIAEHHSSVVPWQKVCKAVGANILWIPISSNGKTDEVALEQILQSQQCKAVIHTALSNVLGVKNEIKRITTLAHAHHALSIIDAAQYIAHSTIDVQSIDCDALVFSGYKLYGPTGIGVLYYKKSIAETLPSFLGGGMMIETVSTESYTDAILPYKFEAGTPPIADAIALGATIQWLQTLPLQQIYLKEEQMIKILYDELIHLPGIMVIGSDVVRSNCISFYHNKIHAHDLADILAQKGIAVRAGTHCTQPLHSSLQCNASVRASVGMYTTEEDCAALITELQKITSSLL